MFRIIPAFVLFAMVALSSGCQRRLLTARSEAVNVEYLASYRVESPDPRRYCGYCGQNVIAEWDLPDKISCLPGLQLKLSMITSKHQLETITIPIKQPWGYYVYRNINDRLMKNGAVLTYKVEIFSQDQLITCWKQQGWVEWIEICPEDAERDSLPSN
jgi:hypothetical protein